LFKNGIRPFFRFPLSAPLPQVTSRYTSREKESIKIYQEVQSMKFLKNRFVIGALCIVAALLIAFFALPSLQNGNQGAYVSAVRMKQPIETGTQLTAEMLETVSIPETLIEGSISDISSAVGKYAVADLYMGDYLTAEKLSSTLAEQNSFPAGTARGKTVVSVTLPTLASGVSGHLLPGDVVTVMALPRGSVNQSLGVEPETEETDLSGAVIYPELRYVEVCMVTASDGADASVEVQPDEDTKNSLPVTVSFYATEQQALLLAELENQSIIHLAFVARGADVTKYVPDAVLADTEVG
jgi:pilus assembly protein CpaB